MNLKNKEVDILRASLFYMRLHQIWPKKKEESNPGLWFYIRFTITLISSMWLLLGSYLHLIVTIINHTDVDISEDLSVALSMTGVTYLAIIFVTKVKEATIIFNDVADVSKFGKPSKFDETNKLCNFYSKMNYWYCTIGILIYTVCMMMLEDSCEKNNVKKGLNEVCGMVAAAWMPFDFSYCPVKQIYLIVQLYSAQMMFKAGSVISFTLVEISQHIKIKLEHLGEIMMQVFQKDEMSERKRLELFAFCVKYHNYIIDLSQRVDDCYKLCMFMHVVITGIIFACIGHHIMTIFTYGAFIHLIAWMIASFVVCLGGQIITDANLSFAQTVYSCNWYNADVALQKNVLLVIKRAQKPLFLHAGSFGILSFSLFVTILKTSYSYLTLLNSKN